MAFAPIRGAPPGAPNPDFPMENPRVKLAKPSTAPATDDQRSIPPVRQRNTAIEIGGGGVTFTFRIIPEQPALARASMTIHIVAAGSSRSHMLGFLRMSASNARRFFTDLQNDRSPVVATGDEDGDVQIEYESTGAGPVRRTVLPGLFSNSERSNMAGSIADGTDVWVAVPASPPLRLTIRARLDDHWRECGLPVYRCESEGGQMMSLCAGHLQPRN